MLNNFKIVKTVIKNTVVAVIVAFLLQNKISLLRYSIFGFNAVMMKCVLPTRLLNNQLYLDFQQHKEEVTQINLFRIK